MSTPSFLPAPGDDFELVLTRKDVGKKFVCLDGSVTKIVKYDELDRDGTPFLDSEGFWHDSHGRTMVQTTGKRNPSNIFERFKKNGRPD